jgi:hypothetical protein
METIGIRSSTLYATSFPGSFLLWSIHKRKEPGNEVALYAIMAEENIHAGNCDAGLVMQDDEPIGYCHAGPSQRDLISRGMQAGCGCRI